MIFSEIDLCENFYLLKAFPKEKEIDSNTFFKFFSKYIEVVATKTCC